jgi:zinc protease
MRFTPGSSRFRAIVVCCAWLLFALPGWAVALPDGVVQGSTVEGFTEYRLPNGLKVLLFPDASKPTVTVNVTYLVGSRHENYGETGMAHLLEHLLFKGSTRFTNITQDFSQRGMRFNGTTWLDRTNYFESFQASDDNLQWAIEMEADRMVHSFIARKDLDTEMTVVRNEFERGENSPSTVLYKRIQSVAFDWHNYGNATIGNRSDIESVKIENLQAFYRMYYQPDNAVLLISGKFDPARALAWINQSFGKIPKPARSLPQFWTVEPSQDGERSVVVRRKGDVQMVYIAYRIPASVVADTVAAQYAGSILANTPNGRLYKQFVETGKAANVYAFTIGGVAPGLGVIAAQVKKGEAIEPVRDALIAAIESFADTPPTVQEMERVRRESANAVERVLNDPERIAIAMSEYVALGDWRFFFFDRDRMAAVTPEQVTTAALAYLKRDNRTVGLFLPEDTPQRAEIATALPIEEVMRDFRAKAETTTAEVFDPSPANIDRRTEHRQIGGLALAMLPKKSRGETVNVSLRLHWGDEKTLFGKKTVAQLTGALLTAGTGKYTKAQLADEMSKLKMSGGVFAFQTTRANLGAAVELMGHVLREPSFPENELTQLRKQVLVALEANRKDPGAMAGEALSLHFNRYPKGDVRAAESLDDRIADLNAVTLPQIKAFHQQFFGASKGELSIVGDFEPEAAARQVAQAFSGWSSAVPYARVTHSYFDVAAARQTIDTPDKASGVYLAGMNLALAEDDPDYPALLVANYLFGGSGLDSRLMLRVRQKDGLSYGVSSQLSAGEIDHAGHFGISATAAPENLARVEAAVQEELQRAIRDGFSAQEVARAPSGIAQRRLQSRTGDGALASAWTRNLFLQRSFAWTQALDEKIAALTPEQVSAAFAKYVQADKLTVIVAGDEAKATKTVKGP